MHTQSKPAPVPNRPSVGIRMASLMLASLALGWLYNQDSSLGVRSKKPVESSSGKGNQNTTLLMSLEFVDPFQARQRAGELFGAHMDTANQPKTEAAKASIPTIAWLEAKALV